MWTASLPTALRFQHLDVLFRYAVRHHRFQPTYCCRIDRFGNQLHLHLIRFEVYRYYR